jgi:tetratricopeptide (TPR) repeat protein
MAYRLGGSVIVVLMALLSRSAADELDDLFNAAVKKADHVSGEEALKLYGPVLKQAVEAERVDIVENVLLRRAALLNDLGQFAAAAKDCELLENLLSGDSASDHYFRGVARANLLVAKRGLEGETEALAHQFSDLVADIEKTAGRAGLAPNLRVPLKLLLARVSCMQAEILMDMGRSAEALLAVDRGLNQAEGIDFALLAKAHRIRGHVRCAVGRRQEGLQDLRAARKLLVDHGLSGQLLELSVLEDLARNEANATDRKAAFDEFQSVKLATPGPDDAWRVLSAAEMAFDRSEAATAVRWVRHFEQQDYIRHYPYLKRRFLLSKVRIGLLNGDAHWIEDGLADLKKLPTVSKGSVRARWDLMELELQVAVSRGGILEIWQRAQEMYAYLQSLEKTDALRALPISVPQAEHNLASVFLRLGQLAFALHHARNAVTEAKKLGFFQLEQSARLLYAECWLEIDPLGVEFGQKNLPEWRVALDEVAPRLHDLPDDEVAKYHLLYALGLDAAGDYAGARKHLDQTPRVDDPAIAAKHSLLSVGVALSSGDHLSASKELARVPTLADMELEAQRLLFDAILLERDGKLTGAFQEYQAAMSLTLREGRASQSLLIESGYRDTYSAGLRGAIRCSVALCATDPAMLEQAALTIIRAVTPPVSPRPLEATPVIARTLSQFAIQDLTGELIEEKKISEKQITLDRVRNGFFSTYSEYAASTPTAPREDESHRARRALERLVAHAGRAGRQIRIYHFDREGGALLVIVPTGKYRVLPFSKADVDGVREGVRRWTSAIESSREGSLTYAKMSRRLFEELFPDGVQQLTKEFEVVPHRDLWNLTFESLVTKLEDGGNREYLDERFHPTYLTPVFLSQLADTAEPHEDAQDTGTGLARPQRGAFFVGPDAQMRSEQWAVSKIEDNPDTKGLSLELTCVSGELRRMEYGERIWKRLVEAHQKVDPAPSIATFSFEGDIFGTVTSQATWLHFIAHGVAENPWEPHVGIVLRAQDARGLPSDQIAGPIHYKTDGVLTPREIETLNLHCKFVFLQGCNTAKGLVSYSGGSLGLVSSFLTAGAHAVIASRWVVPMDEQLAAEVVNFYGSIDARGCDVSPALTILRRELRRSSAAVAVWAAFSEFR